MPCTECPNGKWKTPNSGCVYRSKAACERAVQAYHAKKHHEPKKN